MRFFSSDSPIVRVINWNRNFLMLFGWLESDIFAYSRHSAGGRFITRSRLARVANSLNKQIVGKRTPRTVWAGWMGEIVEDFSLNFFFPLGYTYIQYTYSRTYIHIAHRGTLFRTAVIISWLLYSKSVRAN